MALLFLGSANVDLTFRLAAMPRLGVTEVCPYQLGFGGKGANQAVQAARLGASVAFCGKVGDDPFGPAIIAQLQQEGISTEHVTTASGVNTGTAVILVDPMGQNSIITHAGPNVHLTTEDIQQAASSIKSAELFVSTLEVHAEPLRLALQTARSNGVRTLLNPAPPVSFPHDLLKLVDICVPNESELAALTGLPVQTIDDLRTASIALKRKGPRAVVVTLGHRGAIIVDEDGQEFVAGTAVKTVDTSGAGDSFIGALAVGLAEGRSLREAAKFANVVASFSVTRLGTQASYATRAEFME